MKEKVWNIQFQFYSYNFANKYFVVLSFKEQTWNIFHVDHDVRLKVDLFNQVSSRLLHEDDASGEEKDDDETDDWIA